MLSSTRVLESSAYPLFFQLREGSEVSVKAAQSSKLLIHESPLQVLPSLAVAVGLHEAIFLQQLHYWLLLSKHEHDGRKWAYNTVEEWNKQFPFWSEKTLRRAITSLREQGVVITRNDLNKAAFDRTTWYSIDYDTLDGIVPPFAQTGTASGQVDQMDVVNLTTTIPIDYQEINREVVLHEQDPTPIFPEPSPPVAAPPPKAPTPHQSMMLALSQVLYGHTFHAVWTAEQRGYLGKTAKKFIELGLTSGDILSWHDSEWKRGYFGQLGSPPNHNQLSEGVGRMAERKLKDKDEGSGSIASADDWRQT